MASVFIRLLYLIIILPAFLSLANYPAFARINTIDNFEARPPIHIRSNTITPNGLSPDTVKAIYHLPLSGGAGTIAIVGAYNSASVESDLNVFSKQFNLPACTVKNNCFEIHKTVSSIRSNSGWATETALDTQWAHAIAPNAKILLVEAKSASGKDLLDAINYAKRRADVVSISMSWGGPEFASETKLDNYFTSSKGAIFFASSGDNGYGVEWPAVSPNVIGVGGTTFHFDKNGNLTSETAWSGSGGGVSFFIKAPDFQLAFDSKTFGGKRTVPDVSYGADPNPGYSIYHNGWLSVGGTSAGAPQWAALHALGKNFTNQRLYHDAQSKKYASYFRDIIRGVNGDCGNVCTAGKSYDTVTGLGSPLTTLY